ncbi:MAG: hypothetical protein M0000_10940 [Actinomycetota bacterium]|nr:hypothetical protein [Actinomycetota bacterium]
MNDAGPTEDGGQMDIELATAALLADNKDVGMMLGVLANSLKESLGSQMEIIASSRGLLRRQTDQIKRMRIRLDQDDYEADFGDGRLTCTVGHTSGNIRIRTEQLPIEQWLSRLLAALQKEAATNQAARAALERVVIGGTL